MKDWEVREAIVKATQDKKKKKEKFSKIITCLFCGIEKVTHRKTAVYCSDKCRYLNWQKRLHIDYFNYRKEVKRLEDIIKVLKERLAKYEEI